LIRPAQVGYAVTPQQVGPDVVATGSAAINLTGLSILGQQIPTMTDIEPANWALSPGRVPSAMSTKAKRR